MKSFKGKRQRRQAMSRGIQRLGLNTTPTVSWKESAAMDSQVWSEIEQSQQQEAILCPDCKLCLPKDAFMRGRARKLNPRCNFCQAKIMRQHLRVVQPPPITSEPEQVIKKCSICSEDKPLTPEYFNRRAMSADGFRSECRTCRSIKKPNEVDAPTVEPPKPERAKQTCKVCHKNKLATTDRFYKGSGPLGLDTTCIECRRERARLLKAGLVERKIHRGPYARKPIPDIIVVDTGRKPNWWQRLCMWLAGY